MTVPFNYVAQGWQCPICQSVWSPTTIQCYNCLGRTTTSSDKIFTKFEPYGIQTGDTCICGKWVSDRDPKCLCNLCNPKSA